MEGRTKTSSTVEIVSHSSLLKDQDATSTVIAGTIIHVERLLGYVGRRVDLDFVLEAIYKFVVSCPRSITQ